jgi:hypothetical protein
MPGWSFQAFSEVLEKAGLGNVRMSPAHEYCFSPSAAQHVREPAIHIHGPHDWLLCLFCHHVPRNQGMELL